MRIMERTHEFFEYVNENKEFIADLFLGLVLCHTTVSKFDK